MQTSKNENELSLHSILFLSFCSLFSVLCSLWLVTFYKMYGIKGLNCYKSSIGVDTMTAIGVDTMTARRTYE